MAGRDQLQIRMGAASAVAILSAVACVPAEAGAVELSCSVDGAQYVGSAADICSAFQNKIDAALTAPTKLVGVFVKHGHKDAIDVDVQILKRGGVVARVKQRKSGTVESYPEIAIDVMDRPLGLRDVEMLAIEVARLVVKPLP
jgi:hypothetical protein